MSASGCVFHRVLIRSGSGSNKASSSAVCRKSVFVVQLQRYTRDQGSSVYFPEAVLHGDDLYDITLTDGDCRLRVTLDPGLNRLAEKNCLRPGTKLSNATFTTSMAVQLPQSSAASGDDESYRLVSVEVKGQAADEADAVRRQEDWNTLPWFGSFQPEGPMVPLRATRSTFLPLWNNVDYCGEVWEEAPPTEEEERDEEISRRPAVTVSELREDFFSGRWGIARGAILQQLIVRIIKKSHLMYYGKADGNCECPYKAMLEVCDRTGSVCVVLWNSVCTSWYRCLKPGDIISLRRYRVKQYFFSRSEEIEISVNSRNPAAQIAILPQSSVSMECRPPDVTYSFCSSADLQRGADGAVCDVIGLVTFSGRAERIRSKDRKGADFLEYRWLRLEDGKSDQPMMVKLFATSQRDTHSKLHPLLVVVCTQMKLVRLPDRPESCFYVTNTKYSQVYCTGLGHHSEMNYHELRPVRHFLRWLRTQDDRQVMSRALIGGFFVYPPPPVSLRMFMKEKRGQPGFLRGGALKREAERLCYRERRTFCIQATVTMVMYHRTGQEDFCRFWREQPSSSSSHLPQPSSSSSHLPQPSSSSSHLPQPSSSSSHPPQPSSSSSHLPPPSSSTRPSPSSSLLPRPSSSLLPRPSSSLLPLPSTSASVHTTLSSSSSPASVVSAGSHFRLRPLHCGAQKASKRKLLQTETPKKRQPNVTFQQEQNNKTASMEFLQNDDDDDGGDSDDGDDSSFTSAPVTPAVEPAAKETLPMYCNHTLREEQSVAVAMGGQVTPNKFDYIHKEYYTLRLKALSDNAVVDAFFLPQSSLLAPPLLPHSNSWSSILSHGAFSSHAPPPSPGDLINKAHHLANQRLVCILEACHLGGDRTELILSRAFLLSE